LKEEKKMLNNLKPATGSRKERTRRCRGLGSGLGKNGGSGNKGQNSRSGSGGKLGFEGGQMPLARRLPKRGTGFKSHCHIVYACVSLDTIDSAFKDGDVVDTTKLVSKGIIKEELYGTKILNGKLEKKLTIKANKFSASALETIKKSGSTSEVVE
jgi:large subunit ribosomal protein L15